MDKFNSMRAFCRIVELGTFVAVAREMNLSPMMISKYVAHLEKSLGVALLNRTTRSVTVTEAGISYYNRSKQLLEELNELEESTSLLGNTVKGVLRINAPIDFGGIHMMPAIKAYQLQYPEVKILMSLDNKPINLRKGTYDVSILVTDTLDPGVVARKIALTELCIYASPDYLEKNGYPQSMEDLTNHQCLHNSNTPHGDFWIYNAHGKIKKVKYDWSFASNNGRVLCEAAVIGMGIVQAPRLTGKYYVENNQLVEILSNYRIPSFSIYATYLQRRFYPAKLSTFIGFLPLFFKTHL